MDTKDYTLKEVSELFSEKKLSPVEYTENVLKCIKENSDLNAIVTVNEELAMKNAEESEKRYMNGTPLSNLDGIPIAIKDIIDTKEIRTTYGCKAYSEHYPDDDAFVVKQMKKAGINVSIKSNTSQFALGPTGEVSFNGAVKNARNPEYTTGGSSSGSASAVAGRLVPAAIGTDSGGSIRVPSSICGTIGIKPTFSLVSNQGIMPVNETVDSTGPLTRTVEDGAMVLQALAGYNINDWRSSPTAYTDYSFKIGMNVDKIKAVVITNLFEGAVMPEVVSGCMKAVDVLKQNGAEIIERKMPDVSDLRVAHQINMLAMAHAYHTDDIKNHRDDIYDEVYARLISGDITSDLCMQYEMRKNEMRKILFELMDGADCLIYPTTPLTACKLGEGHKEIVINGITTSSYSSNGSLTWASSFAGTPCISIPVGFNDIGLPSGMSILGRPYDETTLIGIADNICSSMKLDI